MWYGSVPWKLGEIAQHGNFKLGIFAGLLMERFVTARFKIAGEGRWKYVGSARYSEPCYHC